MFSGTLSPAGYAGAALLRVVIYAALTAGFPFITVGFIKAMGSPGGGASGALAAVLGLYLKPLIHIAFALSLTRISVRRMRDIGGSAALALIVPFLVFADLGFGIAFGAFWGTTFALGILAMPKPWFLMTALACVIALSLAPSDSGPRAQLRGARGVEILAAALLAIVAYAAILNFLVVVGVMISPMAILGVLKVLVFLDLRSYLGAYWPAVPTAASLAVVIAALTLRRNASSAPGAGDLNGGAPRISFGKRNSL